MKRTFYSTIQSYATLCPVMKKGALCYIFDKKIDDLSVDEVQEIVMQGFYQDIFGPPEFFGKELLRLNIWHHNREWDTSYLTEKDHKKISSFEAYTIYLREKYSPSSPYLQFDLAKAYGPFFVGLFFPLTFRFPVRSFVHFLDIDLGYSLNQIRKSGHKQPDDIIDYLYEVLTTHQKTSWKLYSSLQNFSKLSHDGSDMTIDHIEMVQDLESTVNYLKSVFEKMIVIFGYIYNIGDLSGCKTHKQRMTKMQTIEDKTDRFYFKYFIDITSSESLQDLNNIRSASLHKKGKSTHQPHGLEKGEITRKELWGDFILCRDYHYKAITALISILALLQDELNKIDGVLNLPASLTNTVRSIWNGDDSFFRFCAKDGKFYFIVD